MRWSESPQLGPALRTHLTEVSHSTCFSIIFFSSVSQPIHCYFYCQDGSIEVSYTLRVDFLFLFKSGLKPQFNFRRVALSHRALGRSSDELVHFAIENKWCLMISIPEAMCLFLMNHCLQCHFNNKLSCWMLQRIVGILIAFYVSYWKLTSAFYPIINYLALLSSLP